MKDIDFLEVKDEIDKMDDVALLMKVISLNRVDAVADFQYVPNLKEMRTYMSIHMAQLLGRLDKRMIKRQRKSVNK